MNMDMGEFNMLSLKFGKKGWFIIIDMSLPYYYSVLNNKISFSVLLWFSVKKNSRI
jgi:hypothetical protein